MQRKIVSVGMEVPGGDVEYIKFDSDQSLLDADIVLYEPTLGHLSVHDFNTGSLVQGQPVLSELSYFQVRDRCEHWKSELLEAFNTSKLIVVFLAAPIEVYATNGDTVTLLNSYGAIPWNLSVTARCGSRITAGKDLGFLASYWLTFASMSPYEVVIKGEFTETLLVTKHGSHIVAASIRETYGGHALLLLPPIHYAEDEFVESEFVDFTGETTEKSWTDKAMQHGRSFVSEVIAIATALQADTQLTPPPEWVGGNEYRLDTEAKLEKKIRRTRIQIEKMNAAKAALKRELQRAVQLRYLLYERGKPLEAATLEALTLFGFNANPFEDAESEFDAVFESPEGRCLGEVEGKNNHSIKIDKIRQLESNIQEDFAKDDVTAYAKGVLFGNPFRLTPVAKRKPAFTNKCMAAALRSKVALVRTSDMFEPARFLKTRRNAAYARRCRKAIFEAEGKVVEFPDLPKSNPLPEKLKELK